VGVVEQLAARARGPDLRARRLFGVIFSWHRRSVAVLGGVRACVIATRPRHRLQSVDVLGETHSWRLR
jgi:hypothetical protein